MSADEPPAEKSALSSTLDRMKHEVSLTLTPYGGRVFVEHSDTDRVDHSHIELKCWFSPQLFGLNVTIGDEVHPRVGFYDDEGDEEGNEETEVETETGWCLSDVPIMLAIYRVDSNWLSESAERNEGSPVLGHFNYYPRVNTSDGVVNDKRPTITAWMGLGAENFALIRQRLLDFKRYDFEIGLTVTFPYGSVESHEFLGRNVSWDGKETLLVKSGVIVWRKEDWSSDYHRKERLVEKKQVKAELPYDPPREHLEVVAASGRVENALARLNTPLWIAAGALVVLVVRGFS